MIFFVSCETFTAQLRYSMLKACYGLSMFCLKDKGVNSVEIIVYSLQKKSYLVYMGAYILNVLARS